MPHFMMLCAGWLLAHACLVPGFTVKRIPFHVAYIAHLRTHDYPQFTSKLCDSSVSQLEWCELAVTDIDLFSYHHKIKRKHENYNKM